MRPSTLLVAFLLSIVCACGRSSSSAATPPPTVVNLGLAIEDAVENAGATGGSDLWLLPVWESGTGAEDLNHDDDTLDSVVFAYAPLRGAPLNLELALPSDFPPVLSVTASLAAISVGEADQGGADLNGDGDALDRVLHVWEARSGTMRNLALAVPVGTVLVGPSAVLFCVSEEEQGADLDGDGATDGFVAHVYDAATGTVLDTELQRIPSWEDVAAADGWLAFGARETPASGDLNGDGDAFDLSVVQVYGFGELRNTGLASDDPNARIAYADGLFGIAVYEPAQGEADLDGDGDALDRVLHTFEPHAGTVEQLDVDSFGSLLGPSSYFERDFLVVLEEEHDDLNDDDFVGNSLPALCEARTGRRLTLGNSLATEAMSRTSVSRLGASFVLRASEAFEHRDLNGDGDTVDELAQVLDASRARAWTLDSECRALTSDAESLVMDREEDEAGEDWNRDGDLSDRQLFRYDATTGRTIATGLYHSDVADLDSAHALVLVNEHFNDEDLNGDGDHEDDVFALYAHATRARWNLGLAGRPGALTYTFPGTAVHRLGLGVALLLVDEAGQGRDLNGDGDEHDTVLHRVDFPGAPAGPAPDGEE